MSKHGMEMTLKLPKHHSAAEETASSDIPSTTTEQGLYLVLIGPPTTDSSSSTARLFLGTQVAARDRTLLLRHGINSIVCVGTPAFHHQPGDDGTFKYLEIQLLDLPSENLLSRLDEAVSFIWDAVRRGQGVLVNCVFAQSRSAAVVTAYLMKQKGWALSHALAEVRRAQPTVHINPGFEAQLTLYQELGCQLPGESYSLTADGIKIQAGATYRWFLLACGLKNSHDSAHLRGINKETRCNGDACNSEEADACGREHVGKLELERKTRKLTTRSFFRCKTCSHPLFSECNVIDHLHPLVRAISDSTYASFSRHGDGSSWLAARDAAAAIVSGSTHTKKKDLSQQRHYKGCISRGKGSFKGPPASTISATSTGRCTSVFTEPLEWIVALDGMRGSSRGTFERVGKITCPRVKDSGAVCGSKLGAWSLNGIDCNCGTTVKPAVQFILSRIERK